jgi:hypothetical protein
VLGAHGVVVGEGRPGVHEGLLDRRLDGVVLLERLPGADGTKANVKYRHAPPW